MAHDLTAPVCERLLPPNDDPAAAAGERGWPCSFAILGILMVLAAPAFVILWRWLDPQFSCRPGTLRCLPTRYIDPRPISRTRRPCLRKRIGTGRIINPGDDRPTTFIGDFPTPVVQPISSGLSAHGAKIFGGIAAHPGSIHHGLTKFLPGACLAMAGAGLT
jgi:hypothetical protein